MATQTVTDTIVEDVHGEIEESLVRDSEKYAIFFKMLRMGVPLDAVKNKMLLKGVSPLVLDLGEDATMSRAVQMEKAFESEKAQQQHSGSNKVGLVVHLEALPEDRVDGKHTLFNDCIVDPSTVNQVEDLLKLFRKKTPEEKEAEKRAADQAEQDTPRSRADTVRKRMSTRHGRVESILDSRRAQAVGIAMKKLGISDATHPTAFLRALDTMDQQFLTAQRIEMLLGCPLWPLNEEESRMLRSKADQNDPMADTDRLLLTVITECPEVRSKVQSLAFRWEFDQQIEEIEHAGKVLKQASKSVLESEKLKYIVQSAILLGNTINKESQVELKAVSLSSLVKLSNVRSLRDKEFTMLDLVVEYCMRVRMDVMNFGEELIAGGVNLAKKIELNVLLKQIREMRRGLESIRQVEALTEFAYSAMRRLDTAESEMGVARDFFAQACTYVGLLPEEMDSNVYYEVVFAFIDNWNKCKAKKERELRAKEQQQQQAEGRKDGEDGMLNRTTRITAQLKNIFKQNSPATVPTPVATGVGRKPVSGPATHRRVSRFENLGVAKAIPSRPPSAAADRAGGQERQRRASRFDFRAVVGVAGYRRAGGGSSNLQQQKAAVVTMTNNNDVHPACEDVAAIPSEQRDSTVSASPVARKCLDEGQQPIENDTCIAARYVSDQTQPSIVVEVS